MELLRSTFIRSMANDMAYHDRSLGTQDAILIGRLHTWQEEWSNNTLARACPTPRRGEKEWAQLSPGFAQDLERI